MAAHQDPFTRSIQPEETELDLYTIPIHTSWFFWDEIHETERVALKEFFDLSSISRTPKIYKEYRDFIINKYREDPSRRLTFTVVRKSLVGDVSLLRKVFLFLEKWGLINFGADSTDTTRDDELKCKVKFEEGLPSGVRVVAAPNSGRPLSMPEIASTSKKISGDASKLPPLASFSDVFSSVMKSKPNQLICGNCSGNCDSGYYECTKEEGFIICVKCFEEGNYGENKSKDDFHLNDCKGSSVTRGAAWTEAETLLLLESVLKHGDDWELVAQSVKSKSKLDCILKLIELPFGEFLLGSANRNVKSSDLDDDVNKDEQLQSPSSGFQDTSSKPDDQCRDSEDEIEKIQNGGDVNQEPPLKKKRISSLSSGGSSLMKQVGLMSAIMGPNIAAAAAESAVAAICNETSCSRELFDGQEISPSIGTGSLPPENNSEREPLAGDSEMKDELIPAEVENTPQNKHPMPLQIRAATATALGAAAAHAKLLADQEDREIEHIVATIIETQLKKLQYKIKHFDDLELIMDKEYAEMEKLKEFITSERLDILQTSLKSGITRWKDHPSLKS